MQLWPNLYLLGPSFGWRWRFEEVRGFAKLVSPFTKFKWGSFLVRIASLPPLKTCRRRLKILRSRGGTRWRQKIKIGELTNRRVNSALKIKPVTLVTRNCYWCYSKKNQIVTNVSKFEYPILSFDSSTTLPPWLSFDDYNYLLQTPSFTLFHSTTLSLGSRCCYSIRRSSFIRYDGITDHGQLFCE